MYKMAAVLRYCCEAALYLTRSRDVGPLWIRTWDMVKSCVPFQASIWKDTCAEHWNPHCAIGCMLVYARNTQSACPLLAAQGWQWLHHRADQGILLPWGWCLWPQVCLQHCCKVRSEACVSALCCGTHAPAAILYILLSSFWGHVAGHKSCRAIACHRDVQQQASICMLSSS